MNVQDKPTSLNATVASSDDDVACRRGSGTLRSATGAIVSLLPRSAYFKSEEGIEEGRTSM